MSHPLQIVEPARRIPVSGTYDVVVVGGGIAGVAAALAAAREGARVCLLERYGALGGLATLGNVTIWLPLCDGRGRQVIGGLGESLMRLAVDAFTHERPDARFVKPPTCWLPDGDIPARVKHRYRASFNPSALLMALEQQVTNAGIALFYDTRFCAVQRDDARITHVIVENKSGRSALDCRTVIDATGDADVCHAATENTVSLDSNVLCGWFYTHDGHTLKLHTLSHPYSHKGDRQQACGPFFRGDDARQVTDHIVQSRQIIRERLALLREQQPERDVQLILPPTLACFRMTRRLEGRFTLAESHMHQWFDDTIGLSGDWRRSGPVFAIPLRALQASRTRNLLVAGRCVSVDNTLWDALRAIPACAVTGEAAGVAAALAARTPAGDTHAIAVKELTAALTHHGVLLSPDLVRPA